MEFGINKEARFQGQIIYSIVTEFDEDDKLQRFSIFFDVRPEVLYYQGFENINQEIEKVTENCILYQGYKEHESVRKDGSRTFSDTDKNIAFFHFEESIIEKIIFLLNIILLIYLKKCPLKKVFQIKDVCTLD